MDWLVGIALTVFAGAVGVGYIVGTVVSKPGEISDASPPAPKTCSDFCQAWQKSRADVCMAKSNLAAAAAWFNACQQASYTAAAAAAAAIAAATAAAWIPFIGPAIAGPLFALSSALVVAAASAYAAMIGAGVAMTQRASDLNSAQTAEMAARAMVMSSCTGTALADCLAMPAPC